MPSRRITSPGARDGILKRPETDPKVIHTDSASEYWHRRASLVHTDTRGQDLELPDNVRLYVWASSQHFAAPRVEAPARGHAQEYANVVATSMFFRACLDNLDAWVTDGHRPAAEPVPASCRRHAGCGGGVAPDVPCHPWCRAAAGAEPAGSTGLRA